MRDQSIETEIVGPLEQAPIKEVVDIQDELNRAKEVLAEVRSVGNSVIVISDDDNVEMKSQANSAINFVEEGKGPVEQEDMEIVEIFFEPNSQKDLTEKFYDTNTSGYNQICSEGRAENTRMLGRIGRRSASVSITSEDQSDGDFAPGRRKPRAASPQVPLNRNRNPPKRVTIQLPVPSAPPPKPNSRVRVLKPKPRYLVDVPVIKVSLGLEPNSKKKLRSIYYEHKLEGKPFFKYGEYSGQIDHKIPSFFYSDETKFSYMLVPETFMTTDDPSMFISMYEKNYTHDEDIPLDNAGPKISFNRETGIFEQNVHGEIPHKARTWAATKGIVFPKTVSARSSGHAFLRTMVDLLVVDNLNILCRNIRDAKVTCVIVDVGSKYASVSTLLSHMADYLGKVVYYLPVRPMDEGYDRTYKRNNHYEAMVDQNLVKLPLYEGYIQDLNVEEYITSFNMQLPFLQAHYLCFDVLYYLADWQPPSEALLYYVGMNFPFIPGKYLLPFGEGTFEIKTNYGNEAAKEEYLDYMDGTDPSVGLQTVCMKPAGADKFYSHNNVHFPNPERSFCFGAGSMYSGVCEGRDLDLRVIPMH